MTQPKPLRIIIVDDHPLFRDGLVTTLKMERDMQLIAEIDDGGLGLKAIRQHKPDLVLLDVNLPTMNGLEVLRELRNEESPPKVIVLTAHHDQEQTLHVIRTGAHAYLQKDVKPDELVRVARIVSQGYYVVDNQQLNETQIKIWIEKQLDALTGPYTVDSKAHYIPLSPREMEILKFVTHGMSNKEIALRLNISQQTVKNHMTSILRKLNVDDRTQAAVTAIRRGWVRIDNSG